MQYIELPNPYDGHHIILATDGNCYTLNCKDVDVFSEMAMMGNSDWVYCNDDMAFSDLSEGAVLGLLFKEGDIIVITTPRDKSDGNTIVIHDVPVYVAQGWTPVIRRGNDVNPDT